MNCENDYSDNCKSISINLFFDEISFEIFWVTFEDWLTKKNFIKCKLVIYFFSTISFVFVFFSFFNFQKKSFNPSPFFTLHASFFPFSLKQPDQDNVTPASGPRLCKPSYSGNFAASPRRWQRHHLCGVYIYFIFFPPSLSLSLSLFTLLFPIFTPPRATFPPRDPPPPHLLNHPSLIVRRCSWVVSLLAAWYFISSFWRSCYSST